MRERKDIDMQDIPSSSPPKSASFSEPTRIAPYAQTLHSTITCCLVELQTTWDEAHVPIGLQLHQLFESLNKDPKVFEDGSIDHIGLFLEKLFTLASPI